MSIQLIIVNDSHANHFYDPEICQIRNEHENITIISNGRNYGKGYSIRRGVDLARGEYIFYSDIDFPIRSEDFLRAYQSLISNHADIVIGERYSCSQVKANSYRAMTSRFFLKIFNMLFDSTITDTQCPFKMFKSSVAKEIFSNQRVNSYAFDTEVLHLARLLGKSILQLSIIWEDTRENWSLFKTIRNYYQMITDLLSAKRYWTMNAKKIPTMAKNKEKIIE